MAVNLSNPDTPNIGRNEEIEPAVRRRNVIEKALTDNSNGALQLVYRHGFVAEPAGNVMPVVKPRIELPKQGEISWFHN